MNNIIETLDAVAGKVKTEALANPLVFKKFEHLLYRNTEDIPQFQVFAVNLAEGTPRIQKGDTVVVTIGVNYTQNAAEDDLIVDTDMAIAQMRDNLKKLPELKNKSFHLIMTNLSPWITKEKWGEIKDKISADVRKDFLNQADKLGYIHELKKILVGLNTVWIGHTKSIWDELIKLMQGDLTCPIFYLAPNLSYPQENPDFFKRIIIKEK